MGLYDLRATSAPASISGAAASTTFPPVSPRSAFCFRPATTEKMIWPTIKKSVECSLFSDVRRPSLRSVENLLFFDFPANNVGCKGFLEKENTKKITKDVKTKESILDSDCNKQGDYLLYSSQCEVSRAHGGETAGRHGSRRSTAHQQAPTAPSRGRHTLTAGVPGA